MKSLLFERGASGTRAGCGGLFPLRKLQRCTQRAPRAAETETRTITNDMVAAYPWTQPGWRGAFVSAQPEETQRLIFAGVTAALALGTLITYSAIGPWVCSTVPTMDKYLERIPFVMGPLFAFAGATHFTQHEAFTISYPYQGAWGFWNLPGSPSFHVNWTGVGEIMGGVGLTLGALHLSLLPTWLEPASAAALFVLAALVAPLNFYMWSHNAPGPLGQDGLDRTYGVGQAIPVSYHIGRACLQIVLLATFLGIALE